MNVSGVLVTRGHTPTARILASWPFPDRIVYDNSVEQDRLCYGRFIGCQRAMNDLVFLQDDDCLLPVQELLDNYDGTMLLNIPPDEKPLLGWGAILDRRDALLALGRYLHGFPLDSLFMRCADVVVTSLVPWGRVDLGHEDLSWATAPDRMYRQDRHYEEREEVRQRCLTL